MPDYIPFHTTRKDANGVIGTWKVGAGWAMFMLGAWQGVAMLALANAIGWGAYGLVELASKVV